jgi:anti-sigma factor RsiW
MPPQPPTAPDDLGDDEHAELTAYVDGRLDAQEREAVEARLSASPERAALVARHRRALQLVEDAAEPAPLGLRTSVQAQYERAAHRPRRRPALIAGAAAALAAAALIVAFILPRGTPGAPTVSEAARLGVRPPTAAAPAIDPARPTLLRQALEGVPFPNWLAKFGWRAVGVRADRLNGRRVVTVYYRKAARELSYSIVGGQALAQPPRALTAIREGTLLRTIRVDGRLVVTWRRGGRTCVLSSRTAPRLVMLKLAGWKGKGTVPF